MADDQDKKQDKKTVAIDIMAPRLRNPGYGRAQLAATSATPLDAAPAAAQRKPAETTPAATTVSPVAPARVQAEPAPVPPAVTVATVSDPVLKSSRAAQVSLAAATTILTPAQLEQQAQTDRIAADRAAQQKRALEDHIAQQAAAKRITEDPHAIAEERLRLDAMYNLASPLFGATAMRIASVNAGANGKIHDRDNDEEEKKEEAQRRQLEFIVTEMFDDLYDTVLRDLEAIQTEIDTCDTEIAERRQRSTAIQDQIDSRQAELDQLRETIRRDRQDLQTANDRIATAETRLADAERDYRAAQQNADPAREEQLKRDAWDQNRDAVRQMYADAGLGSEFDVLERVRNGERVPQSQVEAAMQAVQARELPTDSQAMMIRHLQQTNPNHPYLQTADARRVIMEQARTELGHAQYDAMLVRERILDGRLDFMQGRIQTIEREITDLRAQGAENAERIAELTRRREMLVEQQRRTQELKDRLEDQTFRDRLRNGDPAAQDELERLDRTYREETRARFLGAQAGPASYSLVPAAGAAPVSLSSTPRTTTDSAAGIDATSPLAKNDKMAVNAFTAAAAPSAPSASADPAQTLATTAPEQRRIVAPAQATPV